MYIPKIILLDGIPIIEYITFLNDIYSVLSFNNASAFIIFL